MDTQNLRLVILKEWLLRLTMGIYLIKEERGYDSTDPGKIRVLISPATIPERPYIGRGVIMFKDYSSRDLLEFSEKGANFHEVVMGDLIQSLLFKYVGLSDADNTFVPFDLLVPPRSNLAAYNRRVLEELSDYLDKELGLREPKPIKRSEQSVGYDALSGQLRSWEKGAAEEEE